MGWQLELWTQKCTCEYIFQLFLYILYFLIGSFTKHTHCCLFTVSWYAVHIFVTQINLDDFFTSHSMNLTDVVYSNLVSSKVSRRFSFQRPSFSPLAQDICYKNRLPYVYNGLTHFHLSIPFKDASKFPFAVNGMSLMIPKEKKKTESLGPVRRQLKLKKRRGNRGKWAQCSAIETKTGKQSGKQEDWVNLSPCWFWIVLC